MYSFRPGITRLLSLFIFPLLAISCSSRDDLTKIRELKTRIEEAKQQSDKLSAEIKVVVDNIRAEGSEETTSEKIVKNLKDQESALKAEGGRLTEIANGLEAARTQLEKDRSAFNQTYPH